MFVGLAADAPVWGASTAAPRNCSALRCAPRFREFAENRNRLLAGEVAQALLASEVAQPRARALVSDEHVTVDGTLIQAWAGHKSFTPKPDQGGGGAQAPGSDAPSTLPAGGRNGERNWRGQARSNTAHQSTTDPGARLARKADGQASVLAHAGHVLVENRNGLVVHAGPTRASGTAERDAALDLVDQRNRPKAVCAWLRPRRARTRTGRLRRITLGADKNHDAAPFVAALRRRRRGAHVARHAHTTRCGRQRRSAVPERATHQPGYKLSQRARERVEEVFGWVKQAAGLRQTKHRGTGRVGWQFTLATCAHNLARLPKLLALAPA